MKKRKSDVEVVSRTTPFQGFFSVDRYRMRHRLFAGGWSDEIEREIFERGHAIAVVLYDPGMDRLVLIEQFRAGAFAAIDSGWFGPDASPWLVECVAGIIDEGESPANVVRREALEETGCAVIGEPEFVHHYYASPGGSSESLMLYAARVDASHAGGIHGLDHEHEDIRVFSVPSQDAFQWLASGAIDNATTLIALYWFRDNRERLREMWLGGHAAP